MVKVTIPAALSMPERCSVTGCSCEVLTLSDTATSDAVGPDKPGPLLCASGCVLLVPLLLGRVAGVVDSTIRVNSTKLWPLLPSPPPAPAPPAAVASSNWSRLPLPVAMASVIAFICEPLEASAALCASGASVANTLLSIVNVSFS